MINKLIIAISLILLMTTYWSCSKDLTSKYSELYPAVKEAFGSKIDLDNLPNYANQVRPSYITKDNTGNNPITDRGATLGRVLFYDVQLSTNNKIACATCHIQKFAFGDTALVSRGVNGTTGRHSMRLINTRFASESRFFWDERAVNLENQTTQPIQDHNEMGYSGQNGDPNINDLIAKLSKIQYYKELFKFVYGSEEITESKIQNALAQFVRSIESFDSKYDEGRAMAADDRVNFSNFTAEENLGKRLFLQAPVLDSNSIRTGGGLGCGGCHRLPEADIDPNSLSNGISGSINGGRDFTNTRAPSLRDLVQSSGATNGPMMHTGVIKDLKAAIAHYGNLTNATANNPNLDPRLKPGGKGQQLKLQNEEVNAVEAFLKTLTGTKVYTDSKWSSPF